MTIFDHSQATLRLIGDTLDPVEISRLLGCQPDCSYQKGDELIGKVSGHKRLAPTGHWSIKAAIRKPENLESQIIELLAKLTDDLAIWSQLGARYRLELFCGLFMATGNDGIELSAALMLALGQRGIALGMDVYDSHE